MSTFGLERVFSPRSIAVVGGSPRPSSLGAAVLRNIKASGFGGKVGVVNRQYADVDGVPTVPDLKSLPFTPDLVVISAPAAAVPEIVAEAALAGVAGAAILSAGLGHGAGSLADIAGQTARRHGMRLIGPNCLGVMVPRAKLNASFASHQPSDGHVALISQSGAVASAMIEWAAERRLGFSGIASIGDQLDVDVADLLDHFALDDHTSAILIYLEAVKDARKFMSAARAAARLKPVIIVKSGRMAQGAIAAATHTGALAGSDAVYDAAFRRAGILRVYDLRQLFDCAELLGRGFVPRGNRLAILTNGGGLGILATDRLAELGGVPATLATETIERLDKMLPPGWSCANPVDIAGDADAGMSQRLGAQHAALARESHHREVAGAATEIGHQHRGVMVEAARKGERRADRLVDVARVSGAEPLECGAVALHRELVIGIAASKLHRTADHDGRCAEIEALAGMARQRAQERGEQILELVALPEDLRGVEG